MTYDWSAPDEAYRPGLDPLQRQALSRIGSVRIEGEIGRGGMGVVYRGFDEAAQRPVAVKLLLAGAGAAQAQRERFQRELRLLSQLRHPQLLAIHGSGEVKGLPYMVSEWLEGITLQARVDQHGPLSPGEAAQVLATLARGVAYAHQLGVLHRDIKPENVMLEPRRGPVLLDFGLAKESDPDASRLTRSGSFAGTAAYAAPEQMVDAAKVDARADVYSLGATLFFLLTGESPAASHDSLATLLAAAAGGALPRVRERAPSVPRQLDALVAKAMAGARDERFASADELALALEAFLNPVAEPPAGSRLKVLATAGGVLVALALAYGLGRRGTEAPRSSPAPATSDSSPAAPAGPSPASAEDAPPTPGRDWTLALAELQDQARAHVEAAGVEGPVNAEAWRAQGRELDRLLAAAEATPPSEGGPDAELARGLALVDRGRWREGLEVLARQPSPRAQLSWASATVSAALGADGDPRDALPGLRLLMSCPDTEVAVLAQVWVEALGAKRAGQTEVSAWLERVGRVGGAPEVTRWVNREAWLVAFYALSRLRDPSLRAQLNRALAPLEARSRPPLYSHAFAELLLQSWDQVILAPVQLALFELIVTHAPSPGSVRQLAKLYAVAGYLGGIRRLADLQTGVDLRPMRRVADQVATTRSGPALLSSVVQGRYLTLTLRPDQPAVRVLWEFPPGPWTLRIRGAEVDCDLFLRHDGPPALEDPRTQSSQTMAREEQISSVPGRPTSGLHQILVKRGIPWPEEITLTLELSEGGDEWTAPWQVTPETEGVSLSELAEVRARNQAGRLDEALALLAPLEARYSDLILTRASLLSNASQLDTLRRLPATAGELRPQVRRALLFEAARAASASDAPEEAAGLLKLLLADDPACLLAWEELALARAATDALSEAEALAQQIVAEDPRQEVAQGLCELFARLRAGAGPPSPAERTRWNRNARARELVTRVLLRSRPAEALELLESLPRRAPREELWRATALSALGRGDEARAALAALESVPLAGPRRAQLARLKQALDSRR